MSLYVFAHGHHHGDRGIGGEGARVFGIENIAVHELLAALVPEAQIAVSPRAGRIDPVSYTHLTLPTIYSV